MPDRMDVNHNLSMPPVKTCEFPAPGVGLGLSMCLSRRPRSS